MVYELPQGPEEITWKTPQRRRQSFSRYAKKFGNAAALNDVYWDYVIKFCMLSVNNRLMLASIEDFLTTKGFKGFCPHNQTRLRHVSVNTLYIALKCDKRGGCAKSQQREEPQLPQAWRPLYKRAVCHWLILSTEV